MATIAPMLRKQNTIPRGHALLKCFHGRVRFLNVSIDMKKRNTPYKIDMLCLQTCFTVIYDLILRKRNLAHFKFFIGTVTYIAY